MEKFHIQNKLTTEEEKVTNLKKQIKDLEADNLHDTDKLVELLSKKSEEL